MPGPYEIYLIRHAIAEERSDTWPDDVKRPLTETGISRMRKAVRGLARMGVAWLAEHEFGTLSSGERTRVLLARSLMNEPAIVLLDEPATGLDLAGREQLVAALSELAADPTSPPFVMVSHHVEDVPTNLTHALLLRDGRMLGSGVLDEMLTSDALSDCFGLALRVERRDDGRFSAWARPAT